MKTPLIELEVEGERISRQQIKSIQVDMNYRDWRQSARIELNNGTVPEGEVACYGGYAGYGRILMLKGDVSRIKSAKAFELGSVFPAEFQSRLYFDQPPQTVVEAELNGLELETQLTSERHQIVLSGSSLYNALQKLAQRETPGYCWWLNPDTKSGWWGQVDQSPRWNSKAVYLDNYEGILKHDPARRQVDALFIPWVKPGRCIIVNDLERGVKIQGVITGVSHRLSPLKGYNSLITYKV